MNDSRKWWILSVTSLGSLLSALNFSTLIIALPDLLKGLQASLLQAMWVMLSYMVAQTVMVLMAGSLADRFGRKRIYIGGMLLFTVVSLIAGFAGNAPLLIVLRILQGIGGAMIMANSTAIVADAFPKEELGRALGVNIMVVAVGQIIGPVLGGWLTESFGWEWTFWFNVPFGLIGVIWGIKVLGLKDDKLAAPKTGGLDRGGAVTYVLSITGLLIALTWGPIQSWTSPVVWISGLVFVLLFPAFLRCEKRHPNALLHLPLFANRVFSFGIISATLNALARMGIMFMLIFYFQGALEKDALVAGIMTIPLAAGMLVVSPLAGYLGDKYGETMPATLGLFLNIFGMAGLALDTELSTPFWHLALYMTIISVGAGLFNSPNSSSIMNAAGPKFRGEASGIRSLTTNMGMMLSIAFSMPIVTHSIPHEAMLAIFSGTQVGMDDKSSLHGFITGLHGVFWFMAALMAIATVMSYLRSHRGSRAASGATLPHK
ncbi:drug resistance transporter, EmrB/QacA subfamily [Paenibacillus sp. UNC496MF]|uniref:MFS transporter n=1 Tax=Paenibacillus sp. UNC496MF TaxID=1502753 RepID=UPI0008E211C5|nr:MFS transporter [Paenibacillus sp. UNC496MF]SFI35566.1 drug resistance transporter, EmrB/QacA subfamily [Paenibacillus sp. UNC496MF]